MSRTANRHVRSLKRVLLANALVSSACAVVFLVASGAVAAWTGAARVEIVATGVSLVVFVGMLELVLTRSEPLARWAIGLAWTIAGLDVLWVITTPLKVVPYSLAGRGLFAAIAMVVALFAWFEIRALIGIRRESRRSSFLGGPSEAGDPA